MSTKPFAGRVPAIAIAITLIFSSLGFAQSGANFILRLNDDLITNFRNVGKLKSDLPTTVGNRIETIELRYQGASSETPTTMNLDVDVEGDNAEIQLTDRVLDSIKSQPVRIPLNGKSFRTVYLVYNNPSVLDSNSDSGGSGDGVIMGDGPNRFVLGITDDSKIAGSVVDMTDITLVTNFGDVKVTLDQIAGIRFNTDGEGQAVIFLNNGDAITGTPTLGVVNVETFWGLAEINADNVRSMSASPSATYVQENTDFGTRWKIKMGNALAPGGGR